MPGRKKGRSKPVSSIDIVQFWSKVGRHTKMHPADRAIFGRIKKHGFDLRCLPGCFSGSLKEAPVVLLYLSPGFASFDVAHAKTAAGQEYYEQQRTGRAPLPNRDDHRTAWEWWKSRTKSFGEWKDLRDKIAILNIGAYHSKTFVDIPLLAALPSSRVALEWAQTVLFPQAIKGERVVVCLRAARFWGLTEGRKYGRALYAPRVTRGGYMAKQRKRDREMRDKIMRAVKRAVAGRAHWQGDQREHSPFQPVPLRA